MFSHIIILKFVIWLKSKEGILKFVQLYLSIKSFFKNIYIYEPRILARCVPTWWRNSLFIYLWETDILFRKWLGVATYFCFIFFKRVNKIKKKTLNVTPYLEKGGLWKTKLGLKSKVTYWKGTIKTVTPL